MYTLWKTHLKQGDLKRLKIKIRHIYTRQMQEHGNQRAAS